MRATATSADPLGDRQRCEARRLGHLPHRGEQQPEADAGEDTVEDPCREVARAAGLPAHQPDARDGGRDAGPHEQGGTLAGGDADAHRQESGTDRRDRRDDAHPSGRQAPVEERAAHAAADAGEGTPREVGAGG